MIQNRRSFLKMIGCFGLSFIPFGGLLSCGINFTPAKKALGGLLTDDFKVYNGPNPYVSFHQKYTFKSKMFNANMAIGKRNPGPAWNVGRRPLIASIDGCITKIQRIGGTNGGYRLLLSNDRWNQAYRIAYDHIFSLKVKPWQEVKRGDILGQSNGYFKMILFYIFNTQDPDNYGVNHSYMNYMEDGTVYNSGEDAFALGENQRKILSEIVNCYVGLHKNEIKSLSNFNRGTDNLMHRSPSQINMHNFYWSEIERFRMIEHIFKKSPADFSITQKEFNEIKEKFYSNQPIVLTLPFKKS